MPSRRSDGTGVLIAGGAVATAAFEWSNPDTLGRLSPGDRVVNAVFHSVSLRSAGFDSVGVGALLDETLVVGIALMFIGGAPGSTAGGTRINTVAALVIASHSAAGPEARMEQHVTFEAPDPRSPMS